MAVFTNLLFVFFVVVLHPSMKEEDLLVILL